VALLKQLAPSVCKDLQLENLKDVAEKIIEYSNELGCSNLISTRDILQGNEKVIQLHLADLLHNFSGLNQQSQLLQQYLQKGFFSFFLQHNPHTQAPSSFQRTWSLLMTN
jgi:hypothetical protein